MRESRVFSQGASTNYVGLQKVGVSSESHPISTQHCTTKHLGSMSYLANAALDSDCLKRCSFPRSHSQIQLRGLRDGSIGKGACH